ncbi:MAG: hypothetical protein ACUVTQ_06315 [Desulfotomaculales bacterium]
MEQHWRFKLSWYADGSGRLVAARVEHVDLEVRPPELIMEVAVVAEVAHEGLEVAPPKRTSDSEAPVWVTPAAADGGGVSDAGGPLDFEEVAAVEAGDSGGGGLPPEGVDRGDGPGEVAAGAPAASGATEVHRRAVGTGDEAVGLAAAPGAQAARDGAEAGPDRPGGAQGWTHGAGDEADEVAQEAGAEAASGPAEAGPEAPGSGQDAGPPAGTAAGPSQPRPWQELLWEGIREVRQLDAAAAGRSIVSFDGKNIVFGGP